MICSNSHTITKEIKNISGTLHDHAPSYLILYCMIKDSKTIKPQDLLSFTGAFSVSSQQLPVGGVGTGIGGMSSQVGTSSVMGRTNLQGLT